MGLANLSCLLVPDDHLKTEDKPIPLPHHITSLIRCCKKLGLEYEIMDEYSGQLLAVSQEGKTFIFGTGNICAYPINSATSTFIARDKSHTINVLKKAGFGTPEGNYFFIQDTFKAHRGPGKEKEDAFEYANGVGYPLFVKPNDGSRGAFVEKLYSEEDLRNYINKHASRHGCIRLEKPLEGDEHRLLVIDGKVWFGYKRRPPFITFDGQNNVQEHLVDVIEKQGQSGHISLSLDSSFIRETLTSHGLTLSDIPEQGRTLPFSPAMNLAMGGEIQQYSEEFSEALHDYVRKISKLFNLRVFGLDVYTCGDINDVTDLAILEINGNPSIESAEKYSQTHIIDRLWRYVLQETFKLI